jgi:hypothetical protein
MIILQLHQVHLFKAKIFLGWEDELFKDFNYQEFEDTVSEWSRNLSRLTKTLQVDSSDSMTMLTHISKQLKRYKKQFPVFSALKKRGMAARHWKSLSQRLSLDLDESVTQTSPL